MTHLSVLACSALLVAACSSGTGGSSNSDSAGLNVEGATSDTDVDTSEEAPVPTEAPDEDDASVSTDAPVVTEAPDPASAAISGRCGVQLDDGRYDEIGCWNPHDAEFAGEVVVDSAASSDEAQEEVRLASACAASVESLVERPVSKFGIDVGSIVLDDGTIECWAESSAENSLVGEIADIGIDAALGDQRFLVDLGLGSCFTFVDDDSYDVVSQVSCSDSAKALLFALVMLDDREYPGEDAVVDEAFAKCDVALEASGLDASWPTYSIIFPADPGWTALGQRTVACVGERGDVEAEPAAIWDTPASFEWGVDAPVCLQVIEDGDTNDNSASWNQVDCSTPHTDELLSVVDAPFQALPNDADEAIGLLRDLCNPFLESQTGQPREQPGISVGFSVSASLGTAIDGPVACMATVDNDPFLVGSLSENSIDEVLGDVVVLSRLEPGTCFQFPGDSFTLGTVVGCDEPGAVMAVGTYLLDEVAGTPNVDEQRLERTRKCLPIFEASGLAGDVDTLSGTFPSDSSYVHDGERLATCDIAPL